MAMEYQDALKRAVELLGDGAHVFQMDAVSVWPGRPLCFVGEWVDRCRVFDGDLNFTLFGAGGTWEQALAAAELRLFQNDLMLCTAEPTDEIQGWAIRKGSELFARAHWTPLGGLKVEVVDGRVFEGRRAMEAIGVLEALAGMLCVASPRLGDDPSFVPGRGGFPTDAPILELVENLVEPRRVARAG